MKREDLNPVELDFEPLNLDDLDVELLEQRLELASIATLGCQCRGVYIPTGCPNNYICGTK